MTKLRVEEKDKSHTILEIWGRAQHEAARRHTSDYILGDCNMHKI